MANAKTWFYGQSFHGNIDRSSYATNQEVSERQICPLCKTDVVMEVHQWAKIDGKIAHDYCVRTKVGK